MESQDKQKKDSASSDASCCLPVDCTTHPMRPSVLLAPPFVDERVVLHSCCAPCSAAVLAILIERGITPVVFYCNPNIFPIEEYERRKAENQKYALSLGVDFFDGDYDHDGWKEKIWDLRCEPERGWRCTACFKIRLLETARFAHNNGYRQFSTTLSSSPWKNIEQINSAGAYAAGQFPGLVFWGQNWRKGGLAELQTEISRANSFYRQKYCGCEYSLGRYRATN